jgi:septal ring factor EnvC (AmiA/AmiB activator)
VEASRKEVKKPVLEIGRQIDAIAADYVQEIEAEEVRLSGLVGEWVREQQRKQREADEAARRERERIERERLEAERKAREAEMAALRAQQDASDKSRREAEAAQRQAEAAKREAEEARRRAEEAAKAAQVPAPIQPAQKGVSEVVDFEVVDIDAFHAKFPQLCTVTVNRAAVLAALQKSLAKKGTLPEVVGLRVFQNLRIGRRAL